MFPSVKNYDWLVFQAEFILRRAVGGHETPVLQTSLCLNKDEDTSILRWHKKAMMGNEFNVFHWFFCFIRNEVFLIYISSL